MNPVPELLAPAGNFEKLKAALRFGADAVYLAGKAFGMRSAADNFDDDELRSAVQYAHHMGKKVYLTVNTMPRAHEYAPLREFLMRVGIPAGSDSVPDAMIVADLGVMTMVRELLPQMEIHVSTQAGICSPATAKAFVALGAKRLVLARELNLEEIRLIRVALPDEIELEAFVHGSMCVSYSGRCMLSNELTGRDGNRGMCAQPCRWNYTLVEEKRPDVPLPIETSNLGTFILSSKDMCMIEHIPALMESGISSFKIEGRMKSAYYAAVVSNTYRMAMDAYVRDGEQYAYDPRWYEELQSVSHREYCTGYFLDDCRENSQLASSVGYLREKAYFATALEYDKDALPAALPAVTEHGVLALFGQKNKISIGDAAEFLTPGEIGKAFTVTELYSEDGEPIPSAPHPHQRFFARIPFPVTPGDILRAGRE
ncbi:MAG: U32 family peptidase [Clostridia bacterium]|nr:U32 family peptidase [Clostridia bacterium]